MDIGKSANELHGLKRPKLLSFGQACKARNEPLWYEDRINGLSYRYATLTIASGNKFDDFWNTEYGDCCVSIKGRMEILRSSDYGKKWRLWSMPMIWPTDEELEAAKWEQ